MFLMFYEYIDPIIKAKDKKDTCQRRETLKIGHNRFYLYITLARSEGEELGAKSRSTHCLQHHT